MNMEGRGRLLSAILLTLALSVTSQTGWMTLTAPPSFNSYGCAILLGDKFVYSNQDDTYVYNINADTWASLAARPTSLWRSGCSGISSSLGLFVAGTAPPGASVSNEAHSITDAGVWKSLPSLPSALRGASVDATTSTAWSVGGFSGSLLVSSVFAYNVSLDTWSMKAPMPTPRCYGGTSHYNGKLFYVGGYNTNVGHLLEVYDVAQDAWMTVSSSPSSHFEMSDNANAIDDWLFVLGRFSDPFTHEKYAISSDHWTSLDNPPVTANAGVSALASTSVYYLTTSLHVYHTGDETTNVAYLKPASMSTTNPGYDASLCVDGNTGDPNCHSDGTDAPWLMIDLQGTFSITRIDVYNRLDCCTERFSNVDVHVTTSATIGTQITWTEYMATNAGAVTAFNPNGAAGTHVQLVWRNVETLNLLEVMVYGVEVTTAEESTQAYAWTTVASGPSLSPYGAAATGVDGKTLVLGDSSAYLFDFTSGTWEAVAPSPGAPAYKQGLAALSGPMFLAVGSLGGPNAHLLMSSNDGWTTAEPMPGMPQESVSACSDGSSDAFVVTSGTTQPGQLLKYSAYQPPAQTWSILSYLPFPQTGHACAFSDTLYSVFVIAGTPGANNVFEYNVNQDMWHMRSPVPVQVRNVYDGVAIKAGVVYVTGSDNGQYAMELHSYSTDTDTWTTLPSSPIAHTGPASTMLDDGVFLVFSDSASVHAFSTGSSPVPAEATVEGDPLFTSFGGVSTQLHLSEGVYTLLALPTLVINAAVEVQPWLPPEENHMLTMVGLAGRTASGESVRVDCSTLLSQCTAKGPLAIVPGDHGVTFTMAGVTVGFKYNSLSILARGDTEDIWHSPSHHFDVRFNVDPRLTTQVRGLLGDLDHLGPAHVTAASNDYRVAGGCLFMPQVLATVGVVPDAASLSRDVGC